jgi:cell division protein FtsI/penicillin-binding protein 2
MIGRLQNNMQPGEPGGKKFAIPKKGRIRTVILLLLGIGLVVFIANRNDPVTAHSQAKKIVKGLSGSNRPSQETRLQISRLLHLYPPRLTHARDTLYLSENPVVLHYSLNTYLQDYTRTLLRRYHPRYGAAVALEPATGRILAMVSYTNPQQRSRSSNLCTESCFPAASLFKIVTAAAYFEEKNARPEQHVKIRGRNHTLYLSQLEKQLTHYRTLTFENAFAYSINPVFGRIGIHTLGAETLHEYGERFGFNAYIPFTLPVAHSTMLQPDSAFNIAELASGFNAQTELTPLHAALISAALVNDGTIMQPLLLDSVTTREKNDKIYDAQPAAWKTQILSSQSIEYLSTCMQQVSRYGTARSAFRYVKRSFRFNNIDYGGKTGSINKDNLGKVDWFSGFAAHENDSAQQIAVGVVTVHGDFWTVHSSFVGAEIMRNYIRHLQKQQHTSQERIAEK